MKDGPPLTLDADTFFGALGDAAFYALPEMADLEPLGRSVHAEVRQRFDTGDWGDRHCTNCTSFKKLVRPVINAVALRLRDAEREVRQAFVDYVAKRCRYRPRPVIVYYTDADGTAVRLVM